MSRVVKVLLVFSLVAGVEAIMVKREAIAMIEKVAIDKEAEIIDKQANKLVDLHGRPTKYQRGDKVRIPGGTAEVDGSYNIKWGSYPVYFENGRVGRAYPKDMKSAYGESVQPDAYEKGMKVEIPNLTGVVVSFDGLYGVAVGDDKRMYYVAECDMEPEGQGFSVSNVSTTSDSERNQHSSFFSTTNNEYEKGDNVKIRGGKGTYGEATGNDELHWVKFNNGGHRRLVYRKDVQNRVPYSEGRGVTILDVNGTVNGKLWGDRWEVVGDDGLQRVVSAKELERLDDRDSQQDNSSVSNGELHTAGTADESDPMPEPDQRPDFGDDIKGFGDDQDIDGIDNVSATTNSAGDPSVSANDESSPDGDADAEEPAEESDSSSRHVGGMKRSKHPTNPRIRTKKSNRRTKKSNRRTKKSRVKRKSMMQKEVSHSP